MSAQKVFTTRLAGLPLLDSDARPLGRVEDVVLLPGGPEHPPQMMGVLASVQRRRIFVNAGRLTDISGQGLRIRGGTLDLREFDLRSGEVLASSLYGRTVNGQVVTDISLMASDSRPGGYDVVGVAVGRGGFRTRTSRVLPWREASDLFAGGRAAAALGALRELHPSDLANAVNAMSPARRTVLMEAMEDEELADVLEEMPEDEQIRLLEGMDLERMAGIIEEMEPDDAADLVAELPTDRQTELLAAMDAMPANSLRMLLRYSPTTAGGLMTPQPVIATPETTVAEVLARIRDPHLRQAGATQVFVCQPPTATPTGRYMGVVGFQRLLREAPSVPVRQCIQDSSYIRPDLPETRVAEQLAAYNLLGVAVCDETHRLVGAVTIDDVLDRTLPAGWRRRRD